MFEIDSPDGFTGFSEFPYGCPRCNFKEFHVSVITARDEESIVELETCDAIVMSADTVESFECGEGEDDDAAVGTAGNEGVAEELKLADEGGVALKDSGAVTRKNKV